ncbi:acyl-CoA dehydrogenase family protein [Blastococcus sp. Marseille-P5729]|uniref:acyl-CoA dehydrogenase family protein n=1 Tax=Blastococcus sp. Marseille-P5729 TaxID=2086582 RepID=UPI000D0F7D18|nr:acyl-CoA dehydrogenase family protein [Blastococcus sp. Marseille-P5729]
MTAATPPSELDELATTIRSFCKERLPDPTRARPGEVRDAEAAQAGWRALVSELGVGALLVAEEHGGDGATLVEAGRVAETLGEHVAAVPFLASGVLAPALLNALTEESDDAAGLLRRIAEGAIATVAWAEDQTGSASDAPLWAFDADRVDAQRRYVIDADIADVVLLVGAGGEQIAAVEAADLTITPRASFDLTRGLADVTAASAPAVTLARGDRGRAAFEAMLTAGRLALAAESAGGAVAALRVATDYAKQRVQFGREIGSFQAIKHLLADAFVNAESALSVARLATDSQVADEPDAAELVATASFYCAERFVDVAATGIQVYGGIGFTVETTPHLYRRRAESNRHLLGDPARLKSDYVALLASGAPSIEEARA